MQTRKTTNGHALRCEILYKIGVLTYLQGRFLMFKIESFFPVLHFPIRETITSFHERLPVKFCINFKRKKRSSKPRINTSITR